MTWRSPPASTRIARRAGKPVTGDVPACRGEHVLTRGGEAGRVRALRAGDEAAGDAVRESQQLGEPARGDLLRRGRSGRGDDGERVLVPRARHPVRRHRRRQCATEDKAEVAARLRPDEAGLRGCDQLGDDVGVLAPLVRQRAAEGLDELVVARPRANGSLVERVVELRRVVGGEPEQVVHVAHDALTVPATLAAASRIAPAERSTSSSLVRQFETEIRIAALPCQTVPESQHVPSSWTRLTVACVSASSSPKRTSTWLSTTSLQDLDTGLGAEELREARRVPAAALHHRSDALAPERADRRVDRESARTTGELRNPVHLVARCVRVGLLEIARPHRHRRSVRLRIGAEGDARVIGHIQPLVGVRRPRVRALDAGDEVAEPRRSGGPQAESAVDVQPGVSSLDGVRDRGHVVAGASVDVPDLRAHDRRPGAGRERGREQLDPHAPLPVGRNGLDLCAADPEVAERAVDRHVALLADDDPDPRRALEPVPREIPARPLEDPVPRRCQRRHVGHLATGHEARRDTGREPQQLLQPCERDLLDDSGTRRRPDLGGVLIPGRGEPVGCDGSRQRAADDEAEEAA